MKYFLILLLALVSPWVSATSGGIDTRIVISVEEPGSGEDKTGITNLRGWVVTPFSDYPITRVMLYVDGNYKVDIPIGGSRKDVCAAYNYPNCDTSGFSMAYNYSNLTNGAHTFTIRAVDSAGDYNDAQVSFNVTSINQSFISDPLRINMYSSKVSLLKDSNFDSYDTRIYLENVATDHGCYDFIIEWSKSAQSWVTKQAVRVQDYYCVYIN